ncbi:hypothetical protein E4U55_003838 [Claviceps digitariae]|nr:hypothetical protein E4U55_003838 [Claviceps digitariae]
MSTPQPQRATSPANITASSDLTPSQASFLLSSFTHFLTVAIHSVLYHRALYPSASFLTARAYNLPVHQSRHPAVCAWIRDAVAATAQQIRQGTARQICLAVHEPHALDVVERWIFDVQSFPASAWLPAATAAAPDRDRGSKDKDWAAAAPPLPPWDNHHVLHDYVNRDAGPADDTVNPTDVYEALRAALSRLSYAAQSRSPLPEACTFSLGVELRDEAVAPIHHPQLWIPSQPSLQSRSRKNKSQLRPPRPTTSTTPIRAVQTGPLFFECWVEQPTTPATASPPDDAPGYVLPSTLPSTFESSAAGDGIAAEST